MPRYFFDTFDGKAFIPDEEGQDLKDLDAARRVAQEALREMIRDALPDGDHGTFVVSVKDAAGRVAIRTALALVTEYPSNDEG